jgi:hypothetical protein
VCHADTGREGRLPRQQLRRHLLVDERGGGPSIGRRPAREVLGKGLERSCTRTNCSRRADPHNDEMRAKCTLRQYPQFGGRVVDKTTFCNPPGLLEFKGLKGTQSKFRCVGGASVDTAVS